MHKRGFTLLEMAIVLIIIGLMTAGGVKLINGAISGSKHTSTRNQVEGVLKQLAEYSAISQRIPTTGEVTGVISPFTDDFGNTLNYVPSTDLVTTKSICNTSSTSLTVRKCADTTCTTPTEIYTNIGLFVSSNSVNEIKQVTESGTTISIYNEGTTVNSAANDDIVGWLSLASLKSAAGCEGSSLSIVEDKLPVAYTFSRYSTEIHAKGGIPNYEWCMESDVGSIRNFFKLEGDTILNSGGCTDSTTTYKSTGETNSITFDSDGNTLPADGVLPNVSKITLYLKDSYNTLVHKDFALEITDFIIADSDLDDVPGGDVGGFEFYPDDMTPGAGYGHAAYIIDASDQALSVYLNLDSNHDHQPDAVSVMYGCESDQYPDLPCPQFGHTGAFAAYFTLDYSMKHDHSNLQGFTYTIIRSKYEDKYGDVISTEDVAGADGSGLGYGGENTGFGHGIKGGNSFAIEFDKYDNGSEERDINNDHLAIMTHSKLNDYNETYTNGHSNNDQTYSTLGNVYHRSHDYGWAIIDEESFTSSGHTGTGTYYNNAETVIPNNYKMNDANLLGIRVEAISGCNETGTSCERYDGSGNHVCVFMWKHKKTDMNADSTLQDDMMDVQDTHHSFDNIRNGTSYPSALGEPLMKRCYQDDTTTRNTLDYIRFGFTASAWDKMGNDFHITFSDYVAKVSEY